MFALISLIALVLAVPACSFIVCFCIIFCIIVGDRADNCLPAIMPASTPAAPTVVSATFHSVWNVGEYDIATRCKVNRISKECFDIEVNDSGVVDALHTLDEEYVVLEDGTRLPVYQKDDMPDDEDTQDTLWYD